VAAGKEGLYLGFFRCFFSGLHCFFTVCRLRAFLAFPWQTAEPDVLQQLMGKVSQGCAAAALAAPSSAGEGTLVLIFLIFHWAFLLLFPPDFTRIKTLSFVYFLKMSFTSLHPVSKRLKRMENKGLCLHLLSLPLAPSPACFWTQGGILWPHLRADP